jgi:hypothetical protein
LHDPNGNLFCLYKLKIRKKHAMKKIIIFLIAVGLLLIPFVYQVQSSQNSISPPPVSQDLVRQGDFAFSLLEALEPGPDYSEAQALEMLSEIGIEPNDGWISDYPLTPDIVEELQNALIRAGEKGYLTMNTLEAVNVFNNLIMDYGFPLSPDDNRVQDSKTPPSFGYYDYTSPTVINHFYYHSGPPVVTYYPPPPRYYNLYNWVPYPFWWGSFRFSGYFVLNDFHRSSIVFVLRRHGPKGYFRSRHNVIRVVSSRSKRFDRPKRQIVISPPNRRFEKYRQPGITTRDRTWSGFDEHRTQDTFRVFRNRQEQRRRFNINPGIRQDNARSTVSPFTNRSNERLRRDTTRGNIINRGNQHIDRRTDRQHRMQSDPRPIRSPFDNRRESVIIPRNPGVRDNRGNMDIRELNRAPAFRENPTFRENRNTGVRENRRGFSSGENRSFPGRDHSYFQRSERRSGDTRSWNRGDSRGSSSSREFRQSGRVRGGYSGGGTR